MHNMLRIEFKNNVLKDGQEDTVKIIKENTYQIKLENGIYNVRVHAGDLNDDGDVTLHVILNGERVTPLWVNDRTINSIDYSSVIVDKGVLEIEFFGKYVCLQQIEIARRIDTKVENISINKIIEIDNCQVELSFNSKAQKHMLTKYEIGAGLDEQTIEVNGNKYIDKEVELGKSYEYTVSCIDDMHFNGEPTPKVTVDIKNENKQTVAVKNFEVTKVTGHHVHMHWLKDEGVYRYKLYRKTKLSNYKLIYEYPITYNDEVEAGYNDYFRMLHDYNEERFDNSLDYIEFIDNTVYTDREFEYAIETISLGGVSKKQSLIVPKHAPLRARQMERLDHGLIAVKVTSGVFLAWRLCADEYENNTTFNIYAQEKDGITRRVNDEPIAGATNMIDELGTLDTIYSIRAVNNLIEESNSNTAKVWEHNYLDVNINKPEPYTTPDGNTYEYTANDATVADLDGDGEYEIILKWDCNGKDNSHKGYSGIVYLDAYKLDGTMLWRINMGKNIRCGAHYTQFLVYDFEGTGKADMIVKTADGTTDNLGNVVGNIEADYRNEDGFIIDGPEYLSLIDGLTGEIIDTVLYDPPRGNVARWGDSWGNRVDRFLACVAYLDGIHPSAVMCRGYYDHGRPTYLVAYDVVDRRLTKRWKFMADNTQNIDYTNQGFHNLAVGDVDGDGCDEIAYGACVIDHDGTGLYTTGLEHGDAMHLGKFSPDTVGLDFYGIHEHAHVPYGVEVRNAGTGEIIYGRFTGKDTARGLTAKIDPRYRGNQVWALDDGGLYNIDGTFISKASPSSINFATWWDGDLLRELCDHEWEGYETGIGRPKMYKWDYNNNKLDTIADFEGVRSNNGSKGNPCLQASIFGDWREEVMFRSVDSTFLRIYTTTDLTNYKFYTFMHDYIYRLGIAWQNTAYNQPPHTSFYIGPEMTSIPIPNNYYV